MKYTYDPLVDALLIDIKQGKVTETKEISRDVNIDIDRNGNVLSIEILDASKYADKIKLKKPTFHLVPYSKRKIRELVAK